MSDEETIDERANLERIREILFGARSRDADQRVARLEARLTSEAAALRDELRRRFSDLESHVRGEIEALSARIDAEASSRVDATSLLAKESRDASNSLEQRINRVDESAARGQRDLRRQILDMTRELASQVSRAREELLATMEQQSAPAAEPEQPQEPDRASLH